MQIAEYPGKELIFLIKLFHESTYTFIARVYINNNYASFSRNNAGIINKEI